MVHRELCGLDSARADASIPAALAHGVFLGAAGEGRVASAVRADYAAAASAVLASETAQSGRIYELAGDEAYTLADFADLVAQVSGEPVGYRTLAEGEFAAALIGAGLPEAFAGLLADSDAGAQNGGLFDAGHQLSGLIGRPTTSLASVIATTLAG